MCASTSTEGICSGQGQMTAVCEYDKIFEFNSVSNLI
jgi:hypothetical protein